MNRNDVMLDITARYIDAGMEVSSATVRDYAGWVATQWDILPDEGRDRLLSVGAALYGLSLNDLSAIRMHIKDFPRALLKAAD